jgi:hypothetical protein
VQNIGFSFPFGDGVYTQYSVNTDGNLRLGGTVTGTSSYSTPFSSSNANANSPKINAFGCDGYGVANSHYVKAQSVGDSMLVVEFCMGTYNSTTRNNLYKWQVQLHTNGNIAIVFPDASGIPATAPNVSHQCGLCVSKEDGWVISASANTATTFTNGSSTTNASGTWFDANRYYYFTRPVITCPKPLQLVVSNLSSDEITLSWIPGAEESEWEISLDSIVEYVTDTFYTFTNLTPNTEYMAAVRAICDVDDTSAYKSISLRTACGAMTTLPYTMGFETVDGVTSTGSSTSATFVNCWNRLNNGTTYFGYPYVSNSTSYNHETGGSRGLYWYNTTTTTTYGDYQVVVLPGVDTNVYPTNHLMLTFWAKASDASYHPEFIAGVMTDPTNINTFQQVGGTIHVEGTTWQRYDVFFDEYVGEGQYVALRANRPGSYWYAYLDEFTLDVIPACMEIRHLEAEATVGAAIVSWDPSPSDPQCQAIVEYKIDSVDDWTTAGVAQGFAYSITGLDPATNYNIRVAALCNEAADTSIWQYVDVTTADFGCLGLNETMIGNPNSTTTNYTVPVNNFYNNTMSQQLILASELGTSNGPIRSVSFDYAYSSPSVSKNNCEIWIGLTNLTTLSTSQFLDTADMTLVYTGPLNCVQGWNTFDLLAMGDTVNYDGNSNVVVCVIDNSGDYDGSSYTFRTSPANGMTMAYYSDSYNYYGNPSSMSHTTYSYRTNMMLSIGECQGTATCAAPAASVAYSDTTNVTLVWAPGASETSWEVWYRSGNASPYTVAATALTETEYTVEDLMPGTAYDFVVVNICDPDTFISNVVSIFTDCAPIDGMFDDFESYATGSTADLNPCWNKGVYGTTTQYPYPYSIGGTQALYFYGYNYNNGSSRYYDWLILPPMRDSVNNYEIEFDLRKYSTSINYPTAVMIGVVSDPTDISTFDTLATFTATTYGMWEPFNYSFENYHGEGQYIAIMAPSLTMAGQTYVYNYVYLDNLYVGRRSSCTKPTRFHARDITANSAELAWDSVEAYQNVRILYNTSNDINSALEITSSDATAQLSGLSASTTYYCWLTAFCSDDSSRTVSCSFTTTAACNPVVDLMVTEATSNMASITWRSDDITPASSYTFEWKAADSTTWNSVTTNNTYYQLTNLTQGTTYQVRVVASCDNDSADAATISFTTTVPGTIGSNEGTYYLPTYPLYEYSISEQMWLASELIEYGDTIQGIWFNSESAISDRDVQMWVVDTTLADLSATNYVPSTAMTLVLDSTIDIVAGWNYFPFNEPFVRDVNKNLVVLTYDATGSWESFSGFIATTSTVNSLQAHQDGTPYSTTDLSSLTVEGVRAQMRLEASLLQPTCLAPHPVVSNVTDNSVSLNWIAGMNETAWSVDYRGLSDTTWTVASASTSNTNFTVNGLDPSTTYIFRIGALCSDNTMYAAVRGTTACGTFGVPFLEDFNVYSSNEYDFDPCWFKGNAINTNMPYIVNITGQGPCMLMPQGSYVILPQMGDDVATLQVRLQYVVADVSIYSLVGVCSHPEDILSMTVIDTLWATSAGVAEWFTIPLDSYNGTDGYVAIYSPFNQTYYDNINIEMIPQCGTVDSVQATNITATSADIEWLSGSNGTSYIVEYGPLGSNNYTTVPVNGTTLSLTNLVHSTTYDVNVYTICSAMNDTSFAVNMHFNTECDMVSLPYFEDFEHCNAPALTQTYMLPNCWEYVMTGSTASYTTGSYVPMLYSSTSYASSGNYSLRLYGRTVVALPEMPVNANQLQISFHEYNTSTSYYHLVIGVCDSNWGDFNQSFVPLDTIAVNQTSSWITSYKLAGYTGNGRYIAFTNYYYNSTSDYSYHYIDDITVDYLPSCMPVRDLYVSGNTSSSVTIDWNSYNANDNSWIVSYATAPLTDPMTGTTTAVTSHPYTINGLTAGTDYYIYVRNDCGAGDSSIWSMVGPARPGTWNMRANQIDTVTMCGGTIYDDGGINGTYSASQHSTVIIRPDTPGALVVVSGNSYTESSYDHLHIYDGEGTSGVELWNDNGVSALQNFGPFVSSTGSITLYFQSDGSVNYSGFEVNVNCEIDNCPVSDLMLDTNVAPSSTSLALTWSGSSASYDIIYGPSGFDVDSATTSLSTTTNSIVIPNLTPITTYDIYVRGLCNNGDTGMWHKITLQTPMCDNVFIVENWDSTMTTSTSSYMPMGTSTYNYGYTQTIIDSAFLAGLESEITAMAFHPASTNQGDKYTHITVYLANVPESDLSTSFIHPDDSVHVFVPVISDRDMCYSSTEWQIHGFDSVFTWDGHSNILVSVKRDHGSWVSGASFNGHNTTGSKSRYVYQDGSAYNPTTVSGGSATSTTGDIRLFSCGAACATPTLLPATNLTYNSATLNWNGNATDYEVAVKTVSEAIWPEGTVVSANTYDVNNLTPATTYQFRVRSLCDVEEGLISDWKVATFTTDSLPCFAPSSLEVTNLEMNAASFNWTVNGEETTWRIHVWNTNFDQTYDVTSHPATVTGLTKNTQYNAAVMALCGGILESETSDTVSFTTLDCPVPTNVAVSNVTTHTATITWNGTASSYTLEYGSEGYPQGDGTAIANITGNSYQLTDLVDGYAYDVYVMANCDAQNASDWSTKATFTTLVGINGVEGSMVTVYPNPTSNSTTITLSGVNGDVTIAIVDMNGRTVRSETMNCEGDCAKTMQVNDLAQGAYFVRINGDNVNMVKKLIVK